jgi:PAS domain S-box-containing protein
MNTDDRATALDGLAQEIFEAYPAPTLIVDGEVRLLMANRAARALIGREADVAPLPAAAGEALRCVRSFGPRGCGRQQECESCVVRSSVKRALASGAVHRARTFMRVRGEGGDAEVCLLVTTSPVRHDRTTRVVLTLENVSDVDLKDELLRSQEALRRAHERAVSLARFPEENPDPVLRIASDLTLSYANAAALSTLAEMQLRVGRAVPPALAEAARRAVREGRRAWTEVSCAGRAFALSLCPIGAEVNVYGEDVTDRKRAMDQLAAEKGRLAVTLGSIGDAVIATDESARVTLLNGVAEELTGWKAGECVGRSIQEIFHVINEETRQPADNPVHRALREGVVVGLANHTALVARDGSERPIADSAAPIRDAGGRATGVVLVFRDQTEERRAERALRESEAQLRTIIENLGEGLVVYALDGRPLHWNRAALDMHGFASLDEGSRTLAELAQALELSALDGTVLPLEQWPQARILRGEAVRDLEVQVRRLGGDRGRVLCYGGCLVRDPRGTPLVAVATSSDITERKRTEQALRDADRHKSEFLGILSHELRNPLAPIRNSLYLLDRVAPGSEQAARARAVLGRQTGHLARLIDDLLDVTRISHGKVKLARAIVDAREIVQQACEDHRTIFDELGVDLRIELPGEPVWIEADATRVSQVVGNLLQNAAKFTPRGGATVAAVAVADGRAELQVRDQGIGIDPALIGRLFEPFAQAERGLARTQGGLGLGLALVKGLVELHGGSVGAHSEGPGRGSEFVVLLPLAPAPGAAPAEKGAQRERGARTVLVIEDNLDSAQTLAEVLALNGYRVQVATDGRSGLARARELRPDVVLCDIGLPDLDGYQVALTLRSDAALRATYLVALSGYAQEEDRRLAAQAGFDAHLPKPSPIGDLLAVLSNAR